jgi:hypothetical protein
MAPAVESPGMLVGTVLADDAFYKSSWGLFIISEKSGICHEEFLLVCKPKDMKHILMKETPHFFC